MDKRYWCVSVGFIYRSTDMVSITSLDLVSRNMCCSLEISAENIMLGWKLLASSTKVDKVSRPCDHLMPISSTMNLNHENGLRVTDLNSSIIGEKRLVWRISFSVCCLWRILYNPYIGTVVLIGKLICFSFCTLCLSCNVCISHISNMLSYQVAAGKITWAQKGHNLFCNYFNSYNLCL